MAGKNMLKAVCHACKKEFIRTKKQVAAVIRRSGSWSCKSCSNSEKNKSRARPIGATRVTADGYIEEKTLDGWKRQHRVVMAVAVGRELTPDEAVHHLNEVKNDNRPDNLVIISHGLHTVSHHAGKKRSVHTCRAIADKARQRGRLTMALVSEAKTLHANGVSQHEIARRFCVSPMTINRAVNGKTWKEL